MLDLTCALVGLFVTAPLFVAIAILIKLDSRGPIFFRQYRVGAHDEAFVLLKFRTMAPNAQSRLAEVAHLNVHARRFGDDRFFKAADDPRVTRVGAFLRRYSLDELPQFVNVVRGEMSLVGPRPLMFEEDAHVTGELRRRGHVRPGITGLWQVSGRHRLSFDDMLRLDCDYVDGWAFALDLQVMARTLPVIFERQEAY